MRDTFIPQQSIDFNAVHLLDLVGHVHTLTTRLADMVVEDNLQPDEHDAIRVQALRLDTASEKLRERIYASFPASTTPRRSEVVCTN